MASELRFIIDNLDRGQPLNPEDFALSINEDNDIGARIVSFDNELIFGGDVFNYLYNKLATSGYCELVRVSVQYLCSSGIWQKLVDGYFIVTESTFDLDKCQVKTKLYDETFSTRINNNKGIPFSLSLTRTKNGSVVVPPTLYSLRLFNPNTGGFYGTNYEGYTIFDVFKHLIACMSDNLIDFASTYLTTNFNNFGENLIYSQGNVMRTGSAFEMTATFQDLYSSLRNKLNLGMGFEKQANGRPLLRIEEASYFQQTSPSVTLSDQPSIEMKFDTSRLYQKVSFGGEFIEAFQCDGGNTPCTFVQSAFRGFRTEDFGFIGECNTSNTLNLKTERIIFDTNIIEDVVRFQVEDYDNQNFVISCHWRVPQNYFSAIKYDPYSIGQTVYNGIFTNEQTSANWLNGYPNSLSSFLNGFNPALTTFNVQISFDSPNINNFQYIGQNVPMSINTYNGYYARYLNEFQDPNNLYDTEFYNVPFTGLYTFYASIVFDFPRAANNDPIVLPIDIKRTLTIYHLDSNLGVINQNSISFIDNNAVGLPAFIRFIEIPSWTVVCNQGDKIAVDASIEQLSFGGSNQLKLQKFLRFYNIGGIDRYSVFSGSGVPFDQSILNPVDIDDVQAYLYKFRRPLTMAEINAITTQTSKPILLGRQDNINSVTPTYIKNIQIDSILRKGAEFELRSNKLLP